MDSSIFDEIWEKVLIKSAYNVKKLSGKYTQFHQNKKEEIRQSYETYRAFYKSEYLEQKEGSNIDRHKISACLALSILEVKPFETGVSDLQSVSPLSYLPNELWAIEGAQNVMKIFLLVSWKEKRTTEELIKFFSKEEWHYPELQNQKDYLICLLQDLHTFQNVSEKKDFKYALPFLSHLFYFMESWHLSLSGFQYNEKIKEKA